MWGILEFLGTFCVYRNSRIPSLKTPPHPQKNKKSAIISAKIQRQIMTYTLTLQSDDKSLLRSFKALAREFGAKLDIKE